MPCASSRRTSAPTLASRTWTDRTRCRNVSSISVDLLGGHPAADAAQAVLVADVVLVEARRPGVADVPELGVEALGRGVRRVRRVRRVVDELAAVAQVHPVQAVDQVEQPVAHQLVEELGARRRVDHAVDVEHGVALPVRRAADRAEPRLPAGRDELLERVLLGVGAVVAAGVGVLVEVLAEQGAAVAVGLQPGRQRRRTRGPRASGRTRRPGSGCRARRGCGCTRRTGCSPATCSRWTARRSSGRRSRPGRRPAAGSGASSGAASCPGRPPRSARRWARTGAATVSGEPGECGAATPAQRAPARARSTVTTTSQSAADRPLRLATRSHSHRDGSPADCRLEQETAGQKACGSAVLCPRGDLNPHAR